MQGLDGHAIGLAAHFETDDMEFTAHILETLFSNSGVPALLIAAVSTAPLLRRAWRCGRDCLRRATNEKLRPGQSGRGIPIVPATSSTSALTTLPVRLSRKWRTAPVLA